MAEPAAFAGPMCPTLYRVRSTQREAPDTVTLNLATESRPIGPPKPGQFTMLWAFGKGEAPISIAGLEDDGSLTHTVRGVGAVSRALIESERGDIIGVRGPFGVPWDLDRARGRDILIVAGGLGIAPVRPIIQTALANRSDYGRVVVLLGARSPEHLIYRPELEALAERDDLELELTVDAADTSWPHHVGMVTRLIGPAGLDVGNTNAFVCGPELMMRFTATDLTERGVEHLQVSLERNMHCGLAACGRCQLGPLLLCRDGAVVDWSVAAPLLRVKER